MDDWLFYYFLHSNNSFLEDWNLHDPLYLFNNFPCLDNQPVPDNFHLFDSVLHDNLLPDDWHLIGLFDNGIGKDDLFDDLWNLYNLLYSLDDWDGFLDDSIDYLIPDLNVVLDLFGGSVLDLRDYLFNNFLDLNDLRDLDYSLYQFLHNHRNLNDLLHNLRL